MANKHGSTNSLAVQRGDYRYSIPGPLLFTSFQVLAGPSQWLLLDAHPLSRFGVPRPPTGGEILLPFLSSHPLPLFPLLMTALPTILALKHIYWIWFLCNERVTVPFAFFGGFSHVVYNSITTLVFTAAYANPTFSDKFFYAGSVIYLASIIAELVCELQRHAFKSKPQNKGKLCTTGMWSLCRHPNYGANIPLGFAYGLIAGGPGYSFACGWMYVLNFVYNATPPLEKYCADKYGEQWQKYEKQVPWELFPGIY